MKQSLSQNLVNSVFFKKMLFPLKSFLSKRILSILMSGFALFRVFRYEDFSMNPTNNTIDVFQFFGFSYHKKVKDFLDSHTKSNKGGVSSTFRDSKTAPFKWREKLSMAEVVNIQVGLK